MKHVSLAELDVSRLGLGCMGMSAFYAGAGDESGSGLPEGALQLKNDARMACYVGAGPPEGHGRHRYIFAALALDAERVEIDKEATPALLMFNLFNGTLGRAFLEGWYER